jgi:hypothetical protein
MKIVIFLSVIFLGGCAQLMNEQPPEKPRLIDPGQNLLVTECNGFASGFNVCYQAAKQVCPSGYKVDEWVRNYGSVTRQIIFKCK